MDRHLRSFWRASQEIDRRAVLLFAQELAEDARHNAVGAELDELFAQLERLLKASAFLWAFERESATVAATVATRLASKVPRWLGGLTGDRPAIIPPSYQVCQKPAIRFHLNR